MIGNVKVLCVYSVETPVGPFTINIGNKYQFALTGEQVWVVERYLGDDKFELSAVDCDSTRKCASMTGLGIFYTGATFCTPFPGDD